MDVRAFAVAPTGTTLRIGVEYLPPEIDANSRPEVDRTVRSRPERLTPPPTSLVERSLVPEGRHTWALSADDLSAIDDPIERETLRFVDDLVREDRRLTEREVRLPFLDWQPADLDLGHRLWSEEAIAEAQRQWVDENGLSVAWQGGRSRQRTARSNAQKKKTSGVAASIAGRRAGSHTWNKDAPSSTVASSSSRGSARARM